MLLSQEQAAQAAQRSAAAAARRKSQQQAQPQGTDASDREADDPTALPPAKKAARSGKQPSRRRPLAMDGEADQPATELNPVEVRALLADRTALLRQRGPRLGPQREAAALGPQHADLPLMVTAGASISALLPVAWQVARNWSLDQTADAVTAWTSYAGGLRGQCTGLCMMRRDMSHAFGLCMPIQRALCPCIYSRIADTCTFALWACS